MAFMSKEHTKQIRENLKKQFPNLKFSVRKEHHTSVDVAIVAGDVDFSDILPASGYQQINHYWIKDHYPTHAKLLQAIKDVINEGNYDNSDIMTDYFDVGFYMQLSIGKWDKPYMFKG